MSRELIGIDLDATLIDPGTNKVIYGARERLQAYREAGHHVTIFTSRGDQRYQETHQLLTMLRIPFDRLICGKPLFTRYIGDEAEKFAGWDRDYL